MKMTVEFNTADYEFSHGRSPRGRGSWAFFPRRNADVSEAVWSPGAMTFAEAKRWVREQVRAESPAFSSFRSDSTGAFEVVVGS